MTRTFKAALLGCILASPAWADTLEALPAMPSLSGAQFAGLLTENSGAATLPAHAMTTGIVFPQGRVAAGTAVQVLHELTGHVVAAQLDERTHWPDGSVRTAALSFFDSAQPPGGIHHLIVEAATAASGPALSLAAFTPGMATVTVAMTGGNTYTLDVAQMLATQTPSYWLRGPIATEARLESGTLEGAFHVGIDARVYSDGSSQLDVQFDNDLAINKGGLENYTATIRLGSQSFSTVIKGHGPFTTWHHVLTSNALPAGGMVVPDMDVMNATGQVPAYPTTAGVWLSEIQGELPAANQGGTGLAYAPCDPLGSCGYRRYMEDTGGRADIGVVPRWDGMVLQSFNPSAYAFMMQQADAAGALPWHIEEAPEVPVNIYETSGGQPIHNQWWNDDRCGNAPPQCSPMSFGTAYGEADHGLPIQGTGANGVQVQLPHAPGVAYVPYLLTGSRYYLDEVIANAGQAITGSWPYGVRHWYNGSINPYQDLIIGVNWELRAGAWDMRSVLTGVLAVPDGWPQKTYFSTVLAHNLAFITANAAGNNFGSKGALAGWIDGGLGSSEIAPWQNDYLALSLEWGARAGVPGMAGAVAAMVPFLAGRFDQPANVFSPYDGGDYFMIVLASNNQTPLTTWAAAEQATIAHGTSNSTNPPGTWNCEDYDTAAQSVVDGLPASAAQAQAKAWVDSHISGCRNPAWILSPNQ